MNRDTVTYRLLAAAARAPSGDNCQPWWFRIEQDQRISIGFRPDRARSFFDFGFRGTYVSVGAVIENMRVQAASEGLLADIQYSAERGPQGPVAVVSLRPDVCVKSAAAIARQNAMLARTVNRRPFLFRPPPRKKLEALLADPVAGVRVSVI